MRSAKQKRAFYLPLASLLPAMALNLLTAVLISNRANFPDPVEPVRIAMYCSCAALPLWIVGIYSRLQW